MHRTRFSFCFVLLILFLVLCCGCEFLEKEFGGKKEERQESRSSTSEEVGKDEAPPRKTPVQRNLMEAGVWVTLDAQDSPFFFYRDSIGWRSAAGGAGSYEVTGEKNIRFVIFQDCEEDGWSSDDKSTYPWQTVEVTFPDADHAVLSAGGLMKIDGPLRLLRVDYAAIAGRYDMPYRDTDGTVFGSDWFSLNTDGTVHWHEAMEDGTYLVEGDILTMTFRNGELVSSWKVEPGRMSSPDGDSGVHQGCTAREVTVLLAAGRILPVAA